jgi:hypothetical protein
MPDAARRRLRIAAAVGFSGVLTSMTSQARAADFEVQADSAFQAYAVTDPWGDVVIDRRRLMQTVGLAAYRLQGDYIPGKADYSVVMRMRLNADFGINNHLSGGQAGGETSFTSADGSRGTRFLPGYEEVPIDLMFGYVEGRNLANGLVGFRLGRQYMSDVLGWWGFDGGLVRLTTPFFVQAEVYGGLEQRGGMPLTSSRWERQGVWRGSHANWGTNAENPVVTDYPSFLLVKPAPAFGFALESSGPSFVHGRFSYRRVYNTGATIVSQFPDPAGGYHTIDGTRISQERIGYAADIEKNNLGSARGGFTYDLYGQLVASYYGGLEAYVGRSVTLGADVDYFVPTFDADSIWNWFTHSPITSLTGRAAIRFTRRFDVTASGGARIWAADGDPTSFGKNQCKLIGQPEDCEGKIAIDPAAPGAPALQAFSRDDANRQQSTVVDALGNLSARYRLPSAELSLRSMLQMGARGRRAGGDLAAEKRIDGGRYTVGARASLYNWEDPLRNDRNGLTFANPQPTSVTSFGYVLAAGYRASQLADFRVEWEHDTNELVGQRYRVLALLNLWMVK